MADDRLHFKINGATPETVDPTTALSLALAYFELIRKAGEIDGAALKLTSLSVLPGSVAIATRPDSVKRAKKAASRVNRMVSGRESPPPSIERRLATFRAQLRRLDPGLSASVEVGDLKRPVSLSAEDPGATLPHEITSLRARLVRLGGARPSARFEAVTESGEFTLALADEATARRLGPYVYRELDIDVRIARDEDGSIDSGELLDFVPLSDEDPSDAWAGWFREVSGERWENVTDIEGELGRD